MGKGWLQFLLVGVPVLSLIGSWLALRTIAGRRRQRAGAAPGDYEQSNQAEGK